MPTKNIVFKEKTKELDLDCFSKVSSRQKGELLLPKVFDMFCGSFLSSTSSSSFIACRTMMYPYANLQILTLKGLPVRSNNLHTLRFACPNLQDFTLFGLGNDFNYILILF